MFWTFFCAHKRTSFPQTDRATKQTSVQCLDCGRRIAYSWHEMRQGEVIPDAVQRTSPT